jgi:excisionase family DNA binding protein
MTRASLELPTAPLAYRTRPAAACLGVSVPTLQRWTEAGLIPSSKVGRIRLYEVAVLNAFLARWRTDGPADDVLARALAGADEAIASAEALIAAFEATAPADDDAESDPPDDDEADDAPDESLDLASFRREILEQVDGNGGSLDWAFSEVTKGGRYAHVAGIEDDLRAITPADGIYFVRGQQTGWIAAEFVGGEQVDFVTQNRQADGLGGKWAGIAPRDDDEAVEADVAFVVAKNVYGRRCKPSEYAVTRRRKRLAPKGG